MRDLLLIDLDDTLYDERSYVLSGFRAVADHLAAAHGVDSDACHAAMVEMLSAQGRGHIFDRLLAMLGLPAQPDDVRSLVGIYREHRPAIAFYPGVIDALSRLAAAFDLAVVTDGLGTMQRRKVAALELKRWARPIVYCWEIGAPKPATGGYLAAMRDGARDPAHCVVIGDNPDHDIAAAQAAGLRAIRVRTGRFADRPNPAGAMPVLDIARFTEAESALAKI